MASRLLIKLLALLYSFSETEGCKSVIWLPEVNGSSLLNHVILNITNKQSPDACQVECFMNDNCRSYNYDRKLQLCQLSNSDHMEHPDDLLPREGLAYQGFEERRLFGELYERDPQSSTKNACRSSPCPLGGICQVDFANNSYTCVRPLIRKSKIICENENAQLSCLEGFVIDVEWALYGRSSVSQPCPHDKAETICIKKDTVHETLRRIRDLCQGNNSCSFVANTNTVLGNDPCPGIYKFLELRYVCK
ncbi:adhesion G protein-coupled receptor L3 isoform X2 [Nematostella vectensis]|uniref:adhesion G protein-coupled receptor L3 isoform X2 n=1 Tax=Nematostella vectensis TaxID=45351 RepID=UPI0020772F1F|nr:adhesion G protein-coupled receptor L3 isoform X2 [Nematostella vectensis]